MGLRPTFATQLGIAVGTVNWHLKRLISGGCYVKVMRAERRKLRYLITPRRPGPLRAV